MGFLDEGQQLLPNNPSSPSPTTPPAPSIAPLNPQDLSGIPVVVRFAILGLICLLAFSIRLFAVVRYESVIHEFDPYFNFRTTKVQRLPTYLTHATYMRAHTQPPAPSRHHEACICIRSWLAG
jgi:hypothetical protein